MVVVVGGEGEILNESIILFIYHVSCVPPPDPQEFLWPHVTNPFLADKWIVPTRIKHQSVSCSLHSGQLHSVSSSSSYGRREWA